MNKWIGAAVLIGLLLLLSRIGLDYLRPSASQTTARRSDRVVPSSRTNVGGTSSATQAYTQRNPGSTTNSETPDPTVTTDPPASGNSPVSEATPSLYDRALASIRAGDYQGAITDLDQVIQETPNLAPAYYNRGYARAQLGDTRGAIDDFNRAIELNPTYPEAFYSRGVAFGRLGNEQAARADYRQAATLYRQEGRTREYQTALDASRDFEGLQILW